MHNLALENSDRQAGEAQDELHPGPLCGVSSDIAIVDEREKVEIWFCTRADSQEPL